jgi:hypothetical protein
LNTDRYFNTPHALSVALSVSRFLDPIGTIGWLAHQAGVHPGHLIEAITPGMTRYHALAERSGTDLVSALDRYTAAERWLEEDPRAGIKWLCRNYGIDPRTL